MNLDFFWFCSTKPDQSISPRLFFTVNFMESLVSFFASWVFLNSVSVDAGLPVSGALVSGVFGRCIQVHRDMLFSFTGNEWQSTGL
jgi:hypothetical protein